MRWSTFMRSAWQAAALAAGVLHAASATAQSWQDLEARRAVIAGIDIVVTDVFDVSQPSENHWLGRTANAVHVQTRRAVVERELLFAPGDVVDASRILETERNLRRYAFIRESRIVPNVRPDGSVTARVEALDAWSLNGGVNFNRAGGNTSWGVHLDEANLLGWGKRLAVAHSEDIERTSNEIGYTDPQWLNSRWILSLGYADLSDGRSRSFRLMRPFYALDTRYAVGMDLRTSDFTLTQYHLGASVYTMSARTSSATWFASRAYQTGDHTAWRIGAAYSAARSEYADLTEVRPTGVPAPDLSRRLLRGLSATSSVIQDRPATFENLASIGHTEDYNLGWTISGEAGVHARAFGSESRGAFGSIAVRKGWRLRARGLLLLDVSHTGRRDAGQWRDAVAGARVTAYDRTLRWQTLAASAEFASSVRPDPGHWFYLGGGDGLRGYVDHFLVGDRRFTVSIEDRVVTPWRPFGLVQAGFVAYADAGLMRRLDTGQWSRLYANLGAGLRFGATKSSRGNVVQVSIAMPVIRDAGMDRIQIVLGNTVRF